MYIRGDDSDAFGQDELLRINFTAPEGNSVTKAIVVSGNLKLEFIEPTSPIDIDLSGEQGKILKDRACFDLVLYDENNKQLTIPDIAVIPTREGVL